MKPKAVVLTGAGIIAESGLQTFRGAGGLWNGHSVYEVASPEGFRKNPALVLNFYNQRRREVLKASPNAGHRALVELERKFDTVVVTQNVDDLHERAGSSRVIHLHGEILKARSVDDPELVYDWTSDIRETDRDASGSPLRPHIVWFGEEVPLMEEAARLVLGAELFLVAGTSLQVYPAAGLLSLVQPGVPVYVVDVEAPNHERMGSVHFIAGEAGSVLPSLIKNLVNS